MDFKNFLDEIKMRGEKIRDEVLAELSKSKAIQEIVSNENFIKALARIIETKDEVKRVITKQAQAIFDLMEVPTQTELSKIGRQLSNLESLVNTVARKGIAVTGLPKVKLATKSKKAVKGTARPKKSGKRKK